MAGREAERMTEAERDSEVERKEKFERWEAKDYIVENERDKRNPTKPIAWAIKCETGSVVESFLRNFLKTEGKWKQSIQKGLDVLL